MSNTGTPLFENEPPSTKVLKKHFVDGNLNSTSRETIDCAAHMILVIENPKETVHVALAHMVNRLNVCRADAGFATPDTENYTPIAEYCSTDTNPPSIVGFVLANQHETMQRVWNSASPVKYEDVENNPQLVLIKNKLASLKCKSMLMQRLVWNEKLIGIACVDHTTSNHIWNQTEVEFMERFCTKFLAPLAAISNYWHNPKLHHMFQKPSESELEAIRLASKGMSSKQVADELKKSVRTIENQLRHARKRLNSRNLAELIKKCEPWT
jgi:DNA-binding CsgD family transcriptional regulator